LIRPREGEGEPKRLWGGLGTIPKDTKRKKKIRGGKLMEETEINPAMKKKKPGKNKRGADAPIGREPAGGRNGPL